MRLIARPMLASMFVAGGVNALQNADQIAPKAAPVTGRLKPVVKASPLPLSGEPKQLVQANAVVHIAAGAALATGRFPRLSSAVLAASLVPTTIAGHAYWQEDEPASRKNQRMHFLKNLAVAGGLLLASVDTEGRPSLAWRARRGAGRVKNRTAKLVDR